MRDKGVIELDPYGRIVTICLANELLGGRRERGPYENASTYTDFYSAYSEEERSGVTSYEHSDTTFYLYTAL